MRNRKRLRIRSISSSRGLAGLERVLRGQGRDSAVNPLFFTPSFGPMEPAPPAWCPPGGSPISPGLPEFDEETAQKCIQPLELGQVVVDICVLPPHLTVQELILWPLVQQVEPL